VSKLRTNRLAAARKAGNADKARALAARIQIWVDSRVDGSFAFETPVASGTAYSVSVLSNPPGRICTVTNGSGTVAATNVSTVMVTCSRLPLPPPAVYSNVGAVQTLVIRGCEQASYSRACGRRTPPASGPDHRSPRNSRRPSYWRRSSNEPSE
jgi:hypothetical protein